MKEVQKEQKAVTERSEELRQELSQDNPPQDEPSADQSSQDQQQEQDSSDSQESQQSETERPSDSQSQQDGSKQTEPDKQSPQDGDPEQNAPEDKPSPSPSQPKDPESQQGQSQQSQQQPSESQQSESQQSESQQDSSPKSSSPQTPEQEVEQQLQEAIKKMQEAERELERAKRDEATEQQRQAEENLRAAIDRLERILRQLREEEMLRELAKLEARLRKMASMQTEVLEETIALSATPMVQRNRQTDLKAGDLAFDEKKITMEADRVTNMEPIKNVGRRAGVWNFKAFSGVDPNYEALIRKYVNADIDPALPPLLIEAGAGYGGTVSPSGMREAWPGSDHDFTVTANPGFAIEDVIVDGKSVGAVSSYSLKDIDGGHEIFARFRSENKEAGSVPRTGDLLFSCLAGDLPEEGKIASWPTQFPKGGSLTPMSNPTVTRIDGRKFASVNAAEGDGFRFGSARTEDIECDGFTIVTAVRHRRHSSRDAWDSVVDIFYDRLQLGVYNWNGTVYVRRNGQARTSDFALADGQIAVLSLVVQPDGTWKAFVDNREIMASDSADQMTKLVPGVAGDYGRCINLGRNEPDAWSTFNGEIGDVFLYKTALSDAERKELVNFVAAKLVGGGEANLDK